MRLNILTRIKTMSEYTEKAESFLKASKVEMRAEQAVPQTAPLWAEKDGKHGIKWSIELVRYVSEMRADRHIAGEKNEYKKAIKTIQFFFWDSIASKEAIDRHNQNAMHQRKYPKPEAYNVLANLYHPTQETFEEFCDEYGYDHDSRLAERTYEAVKELNQKLESFFTTEELEALKEIN